VSLLRKSNNRVSSRRQIAIRGVRDGVVSLPGHEYRSIMQVSSVNFELMSEDEQDALIDTYQSFLNSLTSSLQMIVRIREIDMQGYLDGFRERVELEPAVIYRQQIQNYTEFVNSLVSSSKILSRVFYVVMPFRNSHDDFEYAREQLLLTADIVSKGLRRIGLQTRSLSSLEALDLFYSFYSPVQSKMQPITDQTLDLLSNSNI
jgi:hypothetical protein